MSYSKYPGLLATLILSALIVFVVTAIPGVSANDDDDDQAVILEELEEKELKYPNLGSHLSGLAEAYEEGSASQSESAGQAAMSLGRSVAVTIHLTANVSDVVQFLEDSGGDPRNVGEDYIEAYVPIITAGAGLGVSRRHSACERLSLLKRFLRTNYQPGRPSPLVGVPGTEAELPRKKVSRWG